MLKEIIPNRAGEPADILTLQVVQTLERKNYIVFPFNSMAENKFLNRMYHKEFLKAYFRGAVQAPDKKAYTPFGAFVGARLLLAESLGIPQTDQVIQWVYEQAWGEWTK